MTIAAAKSERFPKTEKVEEALERLTDRCAIYRSLLRLEEGANRNNRPSAARVIRDRADETRGLIAASITRLRNLASNAELEDSLEDTCCSGCCPTAHPLATRRTKALERARWLAAATCVYRPGQAEIRMS